MGYELFEDTNNDGKNDDVCVDAQRRRFECDKGGSTVDLSAVFGERRGGILALSQQ
jgi:hypothetical protein